MSGPGEGAVAPDFAVRQIVWMKQEGLWETASPHERALFEKALGSWKKQEIADSQWREEGLAVLVWSVSSGADFPPYDQLASESSVIELVPKPWDAKTFVTHARLRDPLEISRARDTAELWLWRARTTQLQNEHTTLPKGMSLKSIISTAAKAAQADGLFTAIEDDFPALGRSYAKLSDKEWHTLRSIATERLYALNWLSGYSADWDNVPTDT